MASIIFYTAAARSLRLLQQVACWARAELNLTSQMLDDLSADVVSVRHAVLQNRAAIDFLLLAQSHGCEDFKGMSCMNLSDHSESIHKKLQQLKEGLHALRWNDNVFGDWLDGILGGWGLTGWVRSLAKICIYGLAAFVLILLVVPCLLQCLQRLINKSMKNILIVQQEVAWIV